VADLLADDERAVGGGHHAVHAIAERVERGRDSGVRIDSHGGRHARRVAARRAHRVDRLGIGGPAWPDRAEIVARR
jgi:hypothetical protein